ncbi:class IIb bacteriocin, lactobin A/cerein 7B family [Neisseria sp.]|uniref:class IIb bacteriocin, lactobin A/cerein 7B family n=1 Tax=Neisseria sp. TaxID=192066 RepID=UPI0026DAB394|nr:class IIb bacteriocin, lactobin A/cerein 7B family [Neisseria sp.]MDO4906692.1 class IIb bacteriocin, lactobin A/cerein 7B family [Neisseria sp.]
MKELNQFELEKVSGGFLPALAAIPIGWKIFGASAAVGVTAGTAVGLNRVNREKK